MLYQNYKYADGFQDKNLSSMEDEVHCGQPSTSRTDENIERVQVNLSSKHASHHYDL
jgi:hypothetical protein